MTEYDSNRYDPLTMRQWSIHLKKVGRVETLKKKIDANLASDGLRRGMVYWFDYFSKSTDHPYPHFTLHLADKSVMPFRLIHITYNEAVTRLSVTETSDSDSD
jgi:hypothetical protein